MKSEFRELISLHHDSCQQQYVTLFVKSVHIFKNFCKKVMLLYHMIYIFTHILPHVQYVYKEITVIYVGHKARCSYQIFIRFVLSDLRKLYCFKLMYGVNTSGFYVTSVPLALIPVYYFPTFFTLYKKCTIPPP